MTRSALAILFGAVITVFSVLGATATVTYLWPQHVVRTVKNPEWLVWAFLLALCHLSGGILGGYTTAVIAKHAPVRDALIVGVIVLLYLLFQIAGEWGHPFRFYWSLILGLLTVAGVVLGAVGKSRWMSG